MPSRTSPRQRDDDKDPAIPSSVFKGLRAVLLVTFVVITFGVFIYLQHNVLVDTERFVEKQRPKTLQPGVRKTLRSFNNEGNSGSAASQQLRQGSLKGTVARVADTVQGGFIPRRERPEYLQNNPGSASASGSDAGVVGGFAARPAAGGYIKRDLVAHEGHDVSMPVQMVSDVADCEEVCDSKPECRSFSYSRQLAECWLKDACVTNASPAYSGNDPDKRKFVTYYKPCDFGTAAKQQSSSPGRAQVSKSTYVEIDLVANEGGDVGDLDKASRDDCAAACDEEPRCNSFSYSASLRDCWLKDRDFCTGPSSGDFSRAAFKDGDYHTFYRDCEDGNTSGAKRKQGETVKKSLRAALADAQTVVGSANVGASSARDSAAGKNAAAPFVPSSNSVSLTHAPPANERQEAVRDAMKWAWDGYVKYAWGKDELHPKSKKGADWFGLGLTLIDALDTLYIMDLTDEFKVARDWIDNSLNLASPKDVNLFETTIRVLGGLLSTYALSGDEVFKEKAIELGDRLMPAFASKSGVPFSDVNLKSGHAHKPTWGSDSSTAEVTTLQIEFKYLSHISGDRKYAAAVEKVSEHVAGLGKKDGLVPYFINANTGRFGSTTYTLGARGDSYYEYLLKQWLITGRTEDKFKNRYLEAMAGVKKHLIKKTSGSLGLTYVAELSSSGRSLPKMDHLVCFLPGALALGSVMGAGDASTRADHMELAKQVLDCCEHMYSETPTFLAAEITHFDQSGHEVYIKPQDSHNLLRPETLESLFLLWRLTGDRHYQEVGWKIFQAFQKYCKISTGGYTSLDSVLKVPPPQRDKQETFFLGETLKYLYLLFGEDPSLVSLDHFVFNTEAHPLPVFQP